MNKTIDIRNISFRYKESPLWDNVSFTLYGGDIAFLWGLNGSGKTTLGKVLCGLFKPMTGSIEIDGNATMVLAEPSAMLLGSTVQEDVMLGPLSSGLDRDAAYDIALSTLKLCKLDEKINNDTSTLSSGEQRRLAIAGAIALNPDLLILDEPFAFLDDKQVGTLYDIIRNWITESNTVLILSGRQGHSLISNKFFTLDSNYLVEYQNHEAFRTATSKFTI